MHKTAVNQSDVALFQKKLVALKTLIDEDIAAYAGQIESSTLKQFGLHSRLAVDAYLDIFRRGGKRIRGALTMVGYQMLGGQNESMILEAARAIEMIHAYILVIDDINDRSASRRGGPTAHTALADHHKKHHWADGSKHFGESIAMNAALVGNHAAQMILANLDADESLRIKVLSVLNRSLVITAHGQFNDIFNEATGEATEADVDRVLEWKTAYYTFLNPLHVGMILAGAECSDTDAVTDYAMHAGRAFQITDDILGTFGEEFTSGKSPLDDTREGKRTLLSIYALEHAPKADKNFLIQMLGNPALTNKQFARCRDILEECGALEHAKQQATCYVDHATIALGNFPGHWQSQSVQFLKGLAGYLLLRHA